MECAKTLQRRIMRRKNRNSKAKRERAELELQTKMLVEYYKQHMDVFVERELGVSLKQWQRIMLCIIQKTIR